MNEWENENQSIMNGPLMAYVASVISYAEDKGWIKPENPGAMRAYQDALLGAIRLEMTKHHSLDPLHFSGPYFGRVLEKATKDYMLNKPDKLVVLNDQDGAALADLMIACAEKVTASFKKTVRDPRVIDINDKADEVVGIIASMMESEYNLPKEIQIFDNQRMHAAFDLAKRYRQLLNKPLRGMAECRNELKKETRAVITDMLEKKMPEVNEDGIENLLEKYSVFTPPEKSANPTVLVSATGVPDEEQEQRDAPTAKSLSKPLETLAELIMQGRGVDRHSGKHTGSGTLRGGPGV